MALPSFTEPFAAALKKRGIKVEVTVLPDRGHEILLDDSVRKALSELIGNNS